MKQIRILLVDDHSLFRESLSRLLEAEPDLRSRARARTAAEALAALGREPVDVVLLDYDLGEEQGTFSSRRQAPRFRRPHSDGTAGMTDSGTLRAFEAGRPGVFLKHSPPRAAGGGDS